MFKEKAYLASSIDQKLLKIEDPEIHLIYPQMYQLPPQRYPDADDNPNAPKHVNQPQNLWTLFKLTIHIFNNHKTTLTLAVLGVFETNF